MVGKESEHELARSKYLEHSVDQVQVVIAGRVRLEAHVGAARLGRYVYGEVVALGQNGVHRVSARVEEKSVEKRVWKDCVDF